MAHHSREFLEEMIEETKKFLPGWLYAQLFQAARARSGGRARHRALDGPDVFAKLALPEIRPDKLEQVDDEELGVLWLRLHQWFANAKKGGAAIEDIVNAGLWVKQEIERRGRSVKDSELVLEIDRLEETAKERFASVHGVAGQVPELLGGMLKDCPNEVLLVRDFVSVAGSAAVAEKPGDLDVVIRSAYDQKAGNYQLDGVALWAALRRFLAPDKDGPQMQLVASPAGSFTDYVPVFDLVARRREPHVNKIEPTPPEYAGRERVIKQARAASAKITAQAERAKKDDRLTLGEFFYQPKPTRPAMPEETQTVDRLVAMFEERADKWFPTWVQKKYDGVRHQIHKDGRRVVIFSEDGDDNTDRLPNIAKAVQSLKPSQLVLDVEVEAWDKRQHLPRERVSGYLASKEPADDSSLVANVFDVLYCDEGDVHGRALRDRLVKLRELGGGTMGVPDMKRRLNIAPGEEVKTPAELRTAVEKIRKLPGSEGIVAKQLGSTYPLAVTTRDDWVKFHNATTLRGVVLKAHRTKGGVFTYDYGVRPGKEPALNVTAEKVVPVGETFSTGRRFRPGDKILIEAETVNKIKQPDGVKLTAWVPRVLGDYEGATDTVDDVVARASRNLVLQVKRADERGEVVEYFPANVVKVRGEVEVPAVGPEGAAVAFVGASPGRMDVARREPLVGPVGATFNEAYLEPLGLERSEVVLVTAVPRLLTDERGRVREPAHEEIADWNDWLGEEIEKRRPALIVALGKKADTALAGLADVVVPHPAAVHRFGDSGEVGRKLRRVRSEIRKAGNPFAAFLRRGMKRKGMTVEELAERSKMSVAMTREVVSGKIKAPHDKCLRAMARIFGTTVNHLRELAPGRVAKQGPEYELAEGDTRSARASDNWSKNWPKMLPKKQGGKFVYQHHWRGLDEDEAKLDEAALMKTDHSLHGDLRLEGPDGLWGFSVFLGKVADNRDLKDFDKLIDWKEGDNIEAAPKLVQPDEWLEVGARKPLVVEPGGPGATTGKFSKFFKKAAGTYQLGVARKHAVEIFLDSSQLKGRYLITFAPVAGRRRWLIDKPQDQTPLAERRDLADVISELRKKGQRSLIWARPGSKPVEYDTRTGRAVTKSEVGLIQITKADSPKRIVYGVVLDPYGAEGAEADAHLDWPTPACVEETAHGFLAGPRTIGLQHEGKADAQLVESWVEQYPTTDDRLKALAGEPHSVGRRPFGDDVLHSGSWVVGVKLGPSEWAAYQRGEINAFSPGGVGLRSPLQAAQLPEVVFVDFEPKEA